MPAVNYVIYGCFSSRTTPGVITIQELLTGGKTVAVVTQVRVIDGILKRKLCILVDYSYQPKFFNILASGQKYFSIYSPSFFNIHRAIIFSN